MSDVSFSGKILDMPKPEIHHCRPARIVTSGEVFGQVEEGADRNNSELLIMPPFANAHDHVRGVRPISLGGFDMPLELWLAYMSSTPRVDPYLVVAAALGRQALGGVGTVMIHYTRPQNPAAVAEELEVVALMGDLSPADRKQVREKLNLTQLSAETLIALVDDVAERVESPNVNVQYGPYGLEWCSDQLLSRVAERAALTGRRIHMHLLESQLQREYLDHRFPQGPIRHLDDVGLLGPGLSVAHGIWLRPDEMDLLAEREVTVSINSSSNLTIRSGTAPVRVMHKRGVRLAMGLDGFSMDDDDDAFRELRLNYMLHRGEALNDGVPISDLLHAGCYGGRHSVSGIPAGAGIAEGSPADFMVLDYGRISNDVIVDVDEANLLIHRGTADILRHLYVGGRQLVDHGCLTGVDLPAIQSELDAQVRHGAPAFRSWTEITSRLCGELRRFYAAGLHCCG
jgi:cytosine/adenosine deaminase-related metal-dependent hydrolase